MPDTRSRGTPYAEEVALLLRTALAVFVVTIVIGLVNGQRLGQLDPRTERPLLLTHLHTGTIGWITLGLFAAVIWLFTAGRAADGASDGARPLARYAAPAVGCYPVVFFLFYPGGPLGSGAALGVFGTLALIGIVWMLVWTVRQTGHVYLSVARLAGLVAVVNLTLGAVMGVLVEARFAGLEFPGNVNDAHPAMMTIGYILPAAFMFVEWRLGAGIDGRRSPSGTVAVGLLLVGGWLALVAAVANLLELLPLVLLFQVAAVGILAVRMAGTVARVPWLSAGGERHVAVTAIAVVVDVLLLFYTVVNYFAVELEPPRALFIGIAHTEFVGMMTNAVFAAILLATEARREAVLPWADHVVFWGMNAGWVGFALAELLGALPLVPIVTPVMGMSLLLGVATFALRLRAVEAPGVAPAAAGGS
jgi:hypothetical protein